MVDRQADLWQQFDEAAATTRGLVARLERIAMQPPDIVRAGNPNVGHCYHGYFCAGPGGMSKSGSQHIHEIGGMKHEVDLQRHAANKAAYVDKHGAQAYQQRAGRLRAAANEGAKMLTREHIVGLGHERDHLIGLLASKSGSPAERRQWKAEATMIQRQLGRAAKAQQKAASASRGGKGAHSGKHSSAHAAHTLLHLLMTILHTVGSLNEGTKRATAPILTREQQTTQPTSPASPHLADLRQQFEEAAATTRNLVTRLQRVQATCGVDSPPAQGWANEVQISLERTEALARLLGVQIAELERGYNPNQPRDKNGRFASGGGKDAIATPRLADPMHSQAFQRALHDATYRQNPTYGTDKQDHFLTDLLHEHGFGAAPHIASRAEIDQYVKKGEVELFRGDTKPAYRTQLLHGTFRAGTGTGGSGLYAAIRDRSTAARYAGASGVVTRMTLKAGARTITPAELDRQVQRILSGPRLTDPAADMARFEILMNRGRAAAWLGYDAIVDSRFGEVIVLNRNALRVQQENG